MTNILLHQVHTHCLFLFRYASASEPSDFMWFSSQTVRGAGEFEEMGMLAKLSAHLASENLYVLSYPELDIPRFRHELPVGPRY